MLGWAGDMPTVLVDEPMMKPAKKDQVVEVGPTPIGPMLLVMDLQPSSAATARELTASTSPVIDQPTQPPGHRPSIAADTDYDVPIMHSSLDHGVT